MQELLLFCLLSSAPDPAAACGQSGSPPVQQVEQVRYQRPDYTIGPADVLMISVVGLSAFTQWNSPGLDAVVSNSGKIHLPYVGVINVNGMTPAELESEIAEQLRQNDLVKDPQVTVRVKEYRGHTIWIVGEVLQTGQFYLSGETYLMDLMALGMGFPNEGKMYLYRRAPVKAEDASGSQETEAGAGETQVVQAIEIDIREVAEGKRPDLNVRMEGGDVLYVPLNRPKYFYVTGEVANPGAIEIPPRRELLVTQALAFAGAPTKLAKKSKGMLVRYDENGVRQELPIDFDAILSGKQADFLVKPNDIIFVPGSSAKAVTYGLLKIVPTIATTAIVW